MNFVRFIENQYQELKWKESCQEIADKPFNAPLDAEIKASHELLQSYRTFLKWCLKPKLLVHFILVSMKILKEPEPILINKVKERKIAEEAAKKMLSESNVTAITSDVQTPAVAK